MRKHKELEWNVSLLGFVPKALSDLLKPNSFLKIVIKIDLNGCEAMPLSSSQNTKKNPKVWKHLE